MGDENSLASRLGKWRSTDTKPPVSALEPRKEVIAPPPAPAAPPPAAAPAKGDTADNFGFEPLSDRLSEVVQEITADVLAGMSGDLALYGGDNEKEARKQLAEEIRTVLQKRSNADPPLVLSQRERQLVTDALVADIRGLGPIEPLMANTAVTEVMVNGPKSVYVEIRGRLTKTDVRFRNDAHIMSIVEKILSPLGRRCDISQPLEDARLKDGSRVNVIIPPLALNGPVVTIRKFGNKAVSVQDYLNYNSATPDMMRFLQCAVEGKLNVVISGGTGSGKTTLLNLCSSFIPSDERIVTIEDAAELKLQQEHVVSLETRKANVQGAGEVPIGRLLINALRMRPDRIVIGECRGGEALEMLQAMNTGHDGSLTTLHANTPKDALSRLETLCLMSGVDLPQRAIREQIVSAIDLVVQISRIKDGSRKITHITELEHRLEGGGEGAGTPVIQDIFLYEPKFDENGKASGGWKILLRPRCIDKIEEQGVKVPREMFDTITIFDK